MKLINTHKALHNIVLDDEELCILHHVLYRTHPRTRREDEFIIELQDITKPFVIMDKDGKLYE